MKKTFFRLLGLAALVVLTVAFVQPAKAVDAATEYSSPDLAVPRAKIKSKDWTGAIADLKSIAETSTHADVYSLLGFALRNAGHIEEAKVYYAKALQSDPTHKGAHEYLGELYLKIADVPKAKEQLVTLERLCPQGCEELDDLRKSFMETTGSIGEKPK
jgi:tetratricopeptide (TPR) repeat protein